MGRKKPRVTAEADSNEQGSTEAVAGTTAAAPPLLFSQPPPILLPHQIPINSSISRIPPNDPRRNLLTTPAVTAPTPYHNQSIQIESNSYCQPVKPTTMILNESFSSPNAIPVRSTVISPFGLNKSPGAPSASMISPSGITQEYNTKATTVIVKPTNTGELIEEDVYVSDGSDWENEVDEENTIKQENDSDGMDQSDDEDEQKRLNDSSFNLSSTRTGVIKKKTDSLDIILTTSKTGLIRKSSVHQQMLLQAHHQNLQSKQWVRGKKEQAVVTEGEEDDQNAVNGSPIEGQGTIIRQDHDKEPVDTEEENEKKLANLDPATRAAYLLAEKQRKLYEAKITARILESSENAGRDPCLFSKRTAFDIRMDQIEEKPWLRVGGDITDYFNYGLTEEDWMEYSQQQLEVRQELTDASRQKRMPDPTIIPVLPRAPRKQQPRVAVSLKKDAKDEEEEESMMDAPVVGPALPNKVDTESTKSEPENMNGTATDSNSLRDVTMSKADAEFVDIGGGAWGAGAAPGSVLAQLIQDQNVSSGKPPPSIHLPPPPLPTSSLPPPPIMQKMGVPTDPRRSSQPDLLDSQNDLLMYGVHEEIIAHNPPSNRRSGPGRWGEVNDFPGPMYDDFGPPRNTDWSNGRNNQFGPPNPRFPPGHFRSGPPPAYPPQATPSNGNFPPPYHDPPFMPGPGMNHPPPQEFYGERGPPRRMGPGVPNWGYQGPPGGFEHDGNWRRQRDDFSQMSADGGPFNPGGRFPQQGYPGGNKFRR